MNRKLWLIVDGVLIGIILAQTVDASGQTLQPVTSGSFEWWPVILLAVLAAVTVGLVVWHRRNPSSEAQAFAAAHTALAAATHNAHELAAKLLDKIESHHAPLPNDVGATQTPAQPSSPTPEALAAVAAAKEAYAKALAAAGLPGDTV